MEKSHDRKKDSLQLWNLRSKLEVTEREPCGMKAVRNIPNPDGDECRFYRGAPCANEPSNRGCGIGGCV